MYVYSDPKRKDDPHALPDTEVFYLDAGEAENDGWNDELAEPYKTGWYWWSCFPGCLPDSDPVGPFEAEEDAISNAREEYPCIWK